MHPNYFQITTMAIFCLQKPHHWHFQITNLKDINVAIAIYVLCHTSGTLEDITETW